MRSRTLSEGGAAVLEFALLLPVLVLLAVGIMEYGRAVYQYDTLTKAARSAARHISQYSVTDDAAKLRATNLVLYGSTTSTGTLLLPGLSSDLVKFSSGSQASPAMDFVSVAVEGYQFSPLVPAMVPAITFGRVSVTMRQRP